MKLDAGVTPEQFLQALEKPQGPPRARSSAA